MDSASPVSFLLRNVLHELKLRDPILQVYSVDEATREVYCGFTKKPINITGKLILPNFSNGWTPEECRFFLTESYEKNIFGNDNLLKVGIEISQKHFPHFQTNKICKSNFFISTVEKDRETDHISKTFKQMFLRVGKTNNQMKFTRFNEPLKGRRNPFHQLDSVKTEQNLLQAEVDFKKLENCAKDPFISLIVATCKNNKSIKLALDSKLINKRIYKKHPMSKIHELADNIAQMSKDFIGDV